MKQFLGTPYILLCKGFGNSAIFLLHIRSEYAGCCGYDLHVNAMALI
jgi:hypothetical protein